MLIPEQRKWLSLFGVRLLSGIFEKNPPKRTWLCAGNSPVRYALQTWQKSQKTRQVF